jgi:alpha-tubulin suppressor-like RCC1 family protein
LGLDDIRELPKNNEHKPYQPYPTRVTALANKKIVAISCGETHTKCLTESGHLYSFGANGCGQLGQFTNDLEKKRRGSYEEISFPRITNSLDNSGNFNGFDSSNSRQSSPSSSSHRHEDNQNVAVVAPLMSPPPLYSSNDYGIDKTE